MLSVLPYGVASNGTDTHLYQLSNAHGMSVALTEVGASVVSVRVPDKMGNVLDVALGHAGTPGYEQAVGLMGATVGRVANRTAGACFELDGRTYHLAKNEGENNNHGGPDLWCTRLWSVAEAGERRVTFSLPSPDGDQGFPGEVEAHVTYELTNDDRLVVRFEGRPTTRTPMNLTNHTYWNLDGHASGDVLSHGLAVDAEAYLPTGLDNIPLGNPQPVAGTIFDLRSVRVLKDALMELPRGYDHNFCLGTGGALAHAARLEAARSGIAMDVLTDAPGLQVYMAGWLDEPVAKDGARYRPFAGVALEAQHWPDSVHHPDWPNVIYGPERPFSQTIVFAFATS